MQAFPRECSETGVRRMVPAHRCAELRVILMPHPKLDEVVRRHKPPVVDNSAIAVIEVLGCRERKLTG